MSESKEEIEQAADNISLSNLRTLMYAKIFNDEDMKIGYVANVGMFLHDNLNDDRLKDQNFREEQSVRLLELIFKG